MSSYKFALGSRFLEESRLCLPPAFSLRLSLDLAALYEAQFLPLEKYFDLNFDPSNSSADVGRCSFALELIRPGAGSTFEP